MGHVDDFVVDDLLWGVCCLAVATSAWWLSKKVLISPDTDWATRIDWAEAKVFVAQSREAIKDSPAWDPEAAINREDEVRLFDYYGRPLLRITPMRSISVRLIVTSSFAIRPTTAQDSTARYLHLSKVRLSSVKSPVDLVGTTAGKTLG